jgi:ATP synthase protein I
LTLSACYVSEIKVLDKGTKRTAFRLMYASSIGISMVVAIFGSLYLGVWLDKKFGTSPYLTLLFLFMGVIAGFKNLYVMIKRSIDAEKESERGNSEADRKKRPSPKN